MKHANDVETLKANFLQAMANPRRLRVLEILTQGEMTVGSIAEVIGLSQSALSQHLAKLREEGLVKTRREAQMIYYSVSSTRVFEALDMLELLFPIEEAEELKMAS